MRKGYSLGWLFWPLKPVCLSKLISTGRNRASSLSDQRNSVRLEEKPLPLVDNQNQHSGPEIKCTLKENERTRLWRITQSRGRPDFVFKDQGSTLSKRWTDDCGFRHPGRNFMALSFASTNMATRC
jgi:hypothetical protein